MTDTENIEAYHEQFKDNEWAHFLIPQIDFTKDVESNIEIIIESNIKKAPLKTLVSFLLKNFSKKYPKAVEGLEIKQNCTKNDHANQIIKFVSLSHPEANDKMNTLKIKSSLNMKEKNDHRDTTKYENDTDECQNYETPEEKFDPTSSSSEEESNGSDSDPNYEIESDVTDEDEMHVIDVATPEKCRQEGEVSDDQMKLKTIHLKLKKMK